MKDEIPVKILLVLVLLFIGFGKGIKIDISEEMSTDKLVIVNDSYIRAIDNPVIIENEILGNVLSCMAFKESSYNSEAVNMKDIHYCSDGSYKVGSFGLLQFGTDTFNEYAPLAGINNPDIWDSNHQIITANYMLSIGLGERWSTYKHCI